MRFFISPDESGFLTKDGDLLDPPEGWEEVGPDEYATRLAAAQRVGEERAAAWLAAEQQPDAEAAPRTPQAEVGRKAVRRTR